MYTIEFKPEVYDDIKTVYKTVRRKLTRRFPYGVFFIIQDEKIIVIAIMHTETVINYATSLFIVSVGLYFLLDNTYMERNLEHKFSFLFIPLWQLTMLLVSGFVVYLSNGKNS